VTVAPPPVTVRTETTVAPSRNWISPVGVPEPAATVAVRVTERPVAEATRAVVVATLSTSTGCASETESPYAAGLPATKLAV
jgi:Tfp pilus assembly protein PilZ